MSSSQTKKPFTTRCPGRPKTKNIAPEPSPVDDNASITPARRPGRPRMKNVAENSSIVDSNSSMIPAKCFERPRTKNIAAEPLSVNIIAENSSMTSAKCPEHSRIENSKNTTEDLPNNAPISPNTPATPNMILVNPPVTKNLKNIVTKNISTDDTITLDYNIQLDHANNHATQVTQHNYDTQFDHTTQVTQFDYENNSDGETSSVISTDTNSHALSISNESKKVFIPGISKLNI